MNKPMGEYFTMHNSDKESHHSYGPLYDSLFPDRESVRSVLEIGIACGQSILAWLDIFPNAQVVGIDKEPCHNAKVGSTRPDIFPLQPRPPRLEIHQANCRDVGALMAAVGNRQFDFIVEDSSHVLDDNLRCLFLLYPHLSPGGIYVIEEMDGAQSHIERLKLFNNAEILKPAPPHESDWLIVIRNPA